MPDRIFPYDVVDSTNERAFASIEAGAARDGDVHVALGQRVGRGRLGRRWESTPGEGLYLSYVHLPEAPSPSPPTITMTAGLAVRDAVRALGIERAWLDWPNDVMVDDAKLAGILVESRGFDPLEPHFVIGIGVNVLQREFSPELCAERRVTSLALEGARADCEELRELVIARLRVGLSLAAHRPRELERRYLEATGLAGASVGVRTAEALIRGELVDLTLDDGLCVRTSDGEVRLDLAHVHAVDRERR